MRQRQADRDRKCQKRAATHDAYRVTNQPARRALEWIGMPKTRLIFRYDISDILYRMGQKVGEEPPQEQGCVCACVHVCVHVCVCMSVYVYMSVCVWVCECMTIEGGLCNGIKVMVHI